MGLDALLVCVVKKGTSPKVHFVRLCSFSWNLDSSHNPKSCLTPCGYLWLTQLTDGVGWEDRGDLQHPIAQL